MVKYNKKNQEIINNKLTLNIIAHMHYGPICIKTSAIFFNNYVLIKNKIHSMDNAIYNDNLHEIYVNPKIKLRIQLNNTYQLIKTACIAFPIILNYKYNVDL